MIEFRSPHKAPISSMEGMFGKYLHQYYSVTKSESKQNGALAAEEEEVIC